MSGCQGYHPPAKKNLKLLSREDPRNIKYKGHYKIGKAYTIKGTTYKPRQYKRYHKVGVASWYGSEQGFHGSNTANGDIYNKNLLTAAHRTLPLPSLVKVTNLATKKSIIVMVNDRGPYGYNREIDLSERAAKILGFHRKGTTKVRIQYLHKETHNFLKTINLAKREGAKATAPVLNKRCSVNCHIKLVNLKHNIHSVAKSSGRG